MPRGGSRPGAGRKSRKVKENSLKLPPTLPTITEFLTDIDSVKNAALTRIQRISKDPNPATQPEALLAKVLCDFVIKVHELDQVKSVESEDSGQHPDSHPDRKIRKYQVDPLAFMQDE